MKTKRIGQVLEAASAHAADGWSTVGVAPHGVWMEKRVYGREVRIFICATGPKLFS